MSFEELDDRKFKKLNIKLKSRLGLMRIRSNSITLFSHTEIFGQVFIYQTIRLLLLRTGLSFLREGFGMLLLLKESISQTKLFS